MRKIKLFYTFLAFIALVLNACNKEQDKPEETIQNISLEHTEISLKVNESKIIAIQSANGSCTAKCADESKVTAIIEQNNIKITGKTEGETTITIFDSKGKQAEIKVTVLNLVVPGETITIEKGSSVTKTISFGNNYTVTSSNPSIATANIEENTLNIIAIEKGSANIIVKDPKTEKIQEFSVIVNPYKLKIAKTEVTLEGTSVEEITIISGNPDYTIISSKEEIVKATIIGEKNKAIRLQGVSEGNATVSLTDNEKQTITINVTVNAEEESNLFEIDDYGIVIGLLNTPKGAIKFPNKATAIDNEIFYSQKEITSVDFNKVIDIGDSAFAGTSNITTINLSNVQEIGDSAFTGSGLIELTIPISVKKIGRMAFMNNYNLTKIKVLNPVPLDIPGNAFATSIENRNKRILYVPKGSKKAYEAKENWKNEFKNIIEF